MAYEVGSTLKPVDLRGISDEQIEQHWELYEGYVGQVNGLREELHNLRRQGKGGTSLYADRRRRFGFEHNGMVLHEYYFGNLKAGVPELTGTSTLKKALTGQFGTFEAFKDDFLHTGSTRSVGWAILCLDPAAGLLTNHFVELHEHGNVAGFIPILVMDVWEHAYMVDYGAGGRSRYCEAFFGNVNWRVVEKRFSDAVAGRIPSRS